MEQKSQIFTLIGKAIGMIGAIGKDRSSKDRSGAEQFKYRGIDQVYNALNPVMAELGIFFCPEILDLKREERTTRNGAVLTYTVMTIRYTAYAPDGSSVSMTVVGEGMDSGDKSCNKAMSVAMKYAMFQLFCIPTEEMKDPDAEVYTDIMPNGNVQSTNVRPQNAAQQASVNTVDRIPAPQANAPETAPTQPETPGGFIKRRLKEIMPELIEGFNFVEARKSLIAGGVIEDVPSAVITMEQALDLIDAIYKNFRRPEAS